MKFSQKWISWLLLMLFGAISCIVISPVRGIATETPQRQEILRQDDSASDLVKQAKFLYKTGSYTEAIQTLEQALAVDRAQEDPLRQAAILSNIALAYQHLGAWQQVETHVQESLNRLQSLENPDQQILAQTLEIQGSLQLSQGSTEVAAQSWQQATELYQEIGNEAGVIRTQINQAQALQASGYYRRAVKTLTQLETTLQPQPDSLTKAVGYRSLGNALLLVGDTQTAQETLEESLELAESLQSPAEISANFFSLGNLARAQQEYQQAIAYYQDSATASQTPIQQVKARLNELTLLWETETWSDIPTVLAQIEPLIADLPLEHAALYTKINYARNLIRLQAVEVADISAAQIEALLQTAIAQAQKLGDSSAQAYGLIGLGRLYERQQQWSKAETVTEQALMIAQTNNARDIAYQAQWQLGRVVKVQGQEQQAITAYRQAVEILESLRSDLVAVNTEIQFTFRESVEPVYREYVALLLSSEDSKDNLIAAREAIDSLQLAELENFFRATCLDAQPVAIDQITDRDDPTAAIVYPIVLEDRFEIILKLPQEELRHYTSPIDNPQRVERALQRLSQTLTQRNSTETLPLAQQAYRWLIQPVEQDLANSQTKTLVFVLDSPLRNIPMSVLHDGQQYLIEKYAISLAPSLQLVTPRPLAQTQLRALTAGLTEARGGFSPLTYVENELNQIQSQISETKLLLNDAFTSGAFQEQVAQLPYSVVHLATHGQFSSQAENTFIMTWDDRINVNQLDNLLRSSALNNEEAIELLVLSACETLTGDRRAALGLAGVAVRAGARSTLATLWRVNDEATALFMGQLYQELGSQAPPTKAEALRQAQLTLMHDPRFDRPYFWSPYVLVGSWL